MSEIYEFKKMFGYNIPYHSEEKYYFEQLMKSPEYKDLRNNIALFLDFENFLEEKNITMKSYKLDYALDKILTFLTKTQSYKNVFNYEPLEQVQLNDELLLRNPNKQFYLSVDLKESNYNVFKMFDGKNELPDTFGDLIEELKLHPILKTKSYRQLIFGNLLPKKVRKIQKNYINKLLLYVEKEFVSVNNDEIIYNGDEDFIIDLYNKINSSEINEMPITFKIYSEEEVDGIKIRNYLNFETFINERIPLIEYKKLWGVSGDLYHFYFKKYILEEEIEDRDLYFYHNKKLAKWVI
jgi:hypothetical protein